MNLIQPYSGREVSLPARIVPIHGREAEREAILSRVRAWLERDDFEQGVVVIAGLPGGGKTGLLKEVRKQLRELIPGTRHPDTALCRLDGDWSIGTERGSPERARLLNSQADFNELYMRCGMLRWILRNALRADPEGDTLSVEDAYVRTDDGAGFEDTELKIPPKPRLFLHDSVLGVQTLGDTRIPKKTDSLSVFLFLEAWDVIRRAALRDAREKGLPLEERIDFRSQEYRYLVKAMRRALKRADLVARVDMTNYWERLMSKPDAPKIREILRQYPPEVVRAIFPGDLPEDFEAQLAGAVAA